MTCVVGLKHEGSVYLGADSLASNYSVCQVHEGAKLFKNGPFLFGTCGSIRMNQLLKDSLVVPKPTAEYPWYSWRRYRKRDSIEDTKYITTTFMRAIRELLKPEDMQGFFLVGYKNLLFTVQEDYAAVFHPDFAATGSGEYVALGSLYSTTGHEPYERLTKALEAAETLTPFVRRPFIFLKGEKECQTKK